MMKKFEPTCTCIIPSKFPANVKLWQYKNGQKVQNYEIKN